MGTNGVKILVVDDDPFVREMLSFILESNDYLVVSAENGQAALEQCRSCPDINLVVSDVNMPVVDGIELIKTMREEKFEIPIIMVTSVTDISVAVDALSSGAIDYVLKDEGIQETITITVKRALEKHRLKLENIKLLQDLAAKTREQEETLSYLNAIISNMPDGLLVTNSQTCITLVNPAIVNMLGLPDGDMVGRNACEVFSSQQASLYQAICYSCDSPLTAEVPLADDRIGSAVVAPIFTQNTASGRQDKFIGSLMIVRDVTSEKEVEQMKDDFISTVSHELRTPLTSVLGFTKVIRKKLEEVIYPQLQQSDAKTTRTVEQISECIKVIVSEGDRLTNLINDLLDLSKMEAGKIDWKPENNHVDELLLRAAMPMKPLFEQKGIQLTLPEGKNLPLVCCDTDRIIQVVINLLSNALKFTDHGSVSMQTSVVNDPESNSSMIRFAIFDSGIGIAEDDRIRIFEKFRQVGDTLTDRPKGTGLGLPICKQIVEHHGGSIWAEAAPGGGSAFIFTLPVDGRHQP